MEGDCVDVSVCGWGGRWEVGSDTTQNSHLKCLLCGASRTGLPASLCPSLFAPGQHQVSSQPSFLQFEWLFTVCSRLFPQQLSSSSLSLLGHFYVLNDSQLEMERNEVEYSDLDFFSLFLFISAL